MAIMLTTFLLVVRALVRTGEADSFDDNTFNLFVKKLESDAFELAAEVERLYERRCDEETMNDCQNANFGECQKEYPDQQCLEGPNYKVAGCSSGDSGCTGLWSFSVSNIRFSNVLADGGVQGNPTDPSLIESICFTRYLDEWFVKKFEADKAYYKDLGVGARSMYFGSDSGLLRMYPASQSAVCGLFDPRTRPWYVAGSSGPKNVVLILDVSGSMDNRNRLDVLKQAATRIVSTLTVSDRVLIVPFSSIAEPITDNGYVFKATSENKAKLIEKINQLRARGSTNFYDGFLKAFDSLEASATEEFTTGCNTAVLFLTDGENTDGPGLEEVSNLVSTRIKSLSDKLKKPVLLFTYSVSESSDDAVHLYPKQLACSVKLGVWSKITNSDEILDALSNYYRLFAVGLGSDNNQEFAAWVEPYHFATGDTWGTTVSVPVFDRTKTPHLILGVVGVDITMDALDAALATKDATSVVPGSKRADELRAESIKKIVEASEASCPQLNLLPCQMEAYRALSAPDNEGLCGVDCSGVEITQVQAEKCPAVSDHPKTLYAESGGGLLSFAERGVCCRKGETFASSSCAKDSDKPPVGLIVGTVVGGIVGVFIGVYLFLHVKTSPKRRDSKQGETIPVNTNTASPTNPVWSGNPVPALKFANAPSVPASEPSEAGDFEKDSACNGD